MAEETKRNQRSRAPMAPWRKMGRQGMADCAKRYSADGAWMPCCRRPARPPGSGGCRTKKANGRNNARAFINVGRLTPFRRVNRSAPQEGTRQPTRNPQPSYELHHQGSFPLDESGRGESSVTHTIYFLLALESDQRLPRVVRRAWRFCVAGDALGGETPF